ncbi:hypothetical protein HZX00_002838 [Salmonella enterica]|nr:hypothetical protein [Salmonella enterica subsp. enterica serovar Oranienburg]EFQ5901750.1 hypothetical protein [Salmonella enterica]EHE6023272.1 hypothetical protein [Salmonella enterica]
MKARVLVWLFMLACFCGGLALYYVVYQQVRHDISLSCDCTYSRDYPS